MADTVLMLDSTVRERRERAALDLRRRITLAVRDFTDDRISDDEFERRCGAVWDEAERRGLTQRLEDNWQDCS